MTPEKAIQYLLDTDYDFGTLKFKNENERFENIGERTLFFQMGNRRETARDILRYYSGKSKLDSVFDNPFVATRIKAKDFYKEPDKD